MDFKKTSIILFLALFISLFLCVGSACAYETGDGMQTMGNNTQLSSLDDCGDNDVQSNILDTNLKSDVENLQEDENSNSLKHSSNEQLSSETSSSILKDADDDSESDDSETIEVYQYASRVDYVFDKDTKLSNETYRAIGYWEDEVFYGPSSPYLMNDTTWVYCLDSNACDPQGSGYYTPGIYRRITLSDKDKFINIYTGEDVYKYLRTYLYLNYNNDIIGTHSSGKSILSSYVIWVFMEQNYTNPNSYYNSREFGGKKVYEYVKEVMDIVDSGNGVSSNGAFNNSDYLTYQFYLYIADLEKNHRGYQAVLGFNILTKINVTKVWDDDNDSLGRRPDSISVQLYGNNETVGNAVALDEANNWTYVFTDLPVYYAYNMSFELSKDDFSVETSYEDDKACDVTVRKIWDDSYTGEKPSEVLIYLLVNGRAKYGVYLTEEDNWEYTFKVRDKYDANGNEISYSARDMTNPTSTGPVETIVEDARIKNLHFKIINDDLKNETWHIEVFNEGINSAYQLSSANDWSFDLTGLPEDYGEDDFSYFYMYNKPHINVVDYTVKELDLPNLYVHSISSSQEYVNPLMPTQDQVTDENEKYLDEDVNDLKTNFTITNKLEIVNITVKKIWNDDDDKDGIRPEKITINLLANGKVIKTATISKEDWSYTFTGLAKYENDSLIEYSVSEESVEGYSSTIDCSNNTFTITNTHVPESENETSNKTKIPDNETPEKEIPEKEIPKKEVPKVPVSKTATGNPFLALIFSIMTLIIVPKREN